MTQIIILAAGQGRRMGGKDIPKPLVPLAGRTLLHRLLDAVHESGVDDSPLLIVGALGKKVREACADYSCVEQKEQLGTGHAVMIAEEHLQHYRPDHDNVLVLYGDHPFVKPETIKKLDAEHRKQGSVVTMMTLQLPDFEDWRKVYWTFGRIQRDENGEVVGIIEFKDATEEQRKISEVSPSFFCFEKKWLWENIKKLEKNNANGEYYLTDLIQLAHDQGERIASLVVTDPVEGIGVNTPEELALAEKLLDQNS